LQAEEKIALLSQFEPVLRFTQGEVFFPMYISDYIRQCSLWMYQPGREPICVIDEGQLTLDNLADPEVPEPGAVYYLTFISQLNIRELATYQLKHRIEQALSKEKFHAGSGRLARVGYISRLLDAIFSISLLARGRVPGDTAIAARIAYQKICEQNPGYQYYGRIIQQGHWLVLQYWYFYPFNNWRSGFYGVNDHEADWELVSIYLYPQDGAYFPEWVAYSQHEVSGNDIRRRWDDPELTKIGNHPVVYVGAGSHASYFQPGEYLSEIEIGLFSPVIQVWNRVKGFWKRVLRRDVLEAEQGENNELTSIFSVPFIEYARGDGLGIGCQSALPWNPPIDLEDNSRWLQAYRGLWGLFTNDPIAGENAPAGPRYQRDGTVRREWEDPAGWAGLEVVLPPPEEIRQTEIHIRDLDESIQAKKNCFVEKRSELQLRNLELDAMRSSLTNQDLTNEIQLSVQRGAAELNELRLEIEQQEEIVRALEKHLKLLQRGRKTPARAHLNRPAKPMDLQTLRTNRIAEAWAAASIGLLMIGLIAIILFAQEFVLIGIGGLIVGFIFIEAAFRGKLNQLVVQLSIVLAVIASLVLLFEFFWLFIIISVLLAGGYILWENLRELWV
jgi:hypothetical protein